MMSARRSDRTRSFRPLLILACLVIVVQIGAGFLIFSNISSWEERGQFGDMFGAVNTLFSGLAFAGVIYAILLQRKELALQRQELELTRQELARTASAQEDSAKLLEEQMELLKQNQEVEQNRRWLDLQPNLEAVGGDTYTADKGEGIAKFRNTGAKAMDLVVESDLTVRAEIKPVGVRRMLRSGAEMKLEVKYAPGSTNEEKLALKYKDGNGDSGTIEISFDPRSFRFIPGNPRRDV